VRYLPAARHSVSSHLGAGNGCPLGQSKYAALRNIRLLRSPGNATHSLARRSTRV